MLNILGVVMYIHIFTETVNKSVQLSWRYISQSPLTTLSSVFSFGVFLLIKSLIYSVASLVLSCTIQTIFSPKVKHVAYTNTRSPSSVWLMTSIWTWRMLSFFCLSPGVFPKVKANVFKTQFHLNVKKPSVYTCS